MDIAPVGLMSPVKGRENHVERDGGSEEVG